MYSRKELRDKLVQKGEDADTAAYCADWLAEHGFINDETLRRRDRATLCSEESTASAASAWSSAAAE